MAGHRNSYGKRSYTHGDYTENIGSKRRNAGEERDTYAPSPDDTVYRYLCPGRKIGSIIGRGGDIVKQLRSETQSKIKIGETVPGCEERVITIFSLRKETNKFEDTGDYVSPAHDALFKVHERLVRDEDQDDEDADMGMVQVTVRLLVPPDQIGCIIGKGGQIIQDIRNETGAQVRILKNELPACAVSGDELLQISGDGSVVRNALIKVATRLHDNPSRLNHLLSSTAPLPYPPGGPNAVAPIVGMGPLVGPYGGYKGEAGSEWSPFFPGPRDENSAKEFSLRLLCPSSIVGGVIGKGGLIIKQIRQESGAYIKVDSSTTEEDCVITILKKEFFDDPISPTIDAAVRLQPRCSDKTERDSGDPSYTTRILVPTSRIGCLIGKGGSIITEMRRVTRANIRILSKDNLPKVAAEDDEMVQISGDIDVARNALIQVSTRLKANLFEREGALPPLPPPPPPPVPYVPLSADIPDMKYSSRDSKGHGSGYSYSGRYGSSADILTPSEGYTSYSSSQGGGYGGYSSYSSGRSGNGLSGPNPMSLGKHHGY